MAKSARRQGIAINMLHFAMELANCDGKIKVEQDHFAWQQKSCRVPDMKQMMEMGNFFLFCGRRGTGVCACG